MANRPFAVQKAPQAPQTLSPQQIESQEEAREKREAELRRAKLIKTDGIQKIMNSEPYIADCLMPSMLVNNKRVWVTRYYPASRIAIDLFETTPEEQEAMPSVRMKIFRERNIKYAWLGPNNSRLTEIADQLADQS
jgi:hypothetical protein